MTEPDTIAADLLQGADAIAEYLGGKWNSNKVYIAKSRRTLPIRSMEGMGVYAFKSELRTALMAPETLNRRSELREA